MSLHRDGFLPPEEYYSSLPRKRMGAGALLRDERGWVLLVDPVYRETWNLPGGVVEAEESPRAACRREVAEETGLDRPPGRLLAVDWVPSRSGRPEGLILVYDGGTLTPAQIALITVPEDELAGFAFVPPDEVAGRVGDGIGRRVAACLAAAGSGLTAYLENGSP